MTTGMSEGSDELETSVTAADNTEAVGGLQSAPDSQTIYSQHQEQLAQDVSNLRVEDEEHHEDDENGNAAEQQNYSVAENEEGDGTRGTAGVLEQAVSAIASPSADESGEVMSSPMKKTIIGYESEAERLLDYQLRLDMNMGLPYSDHNYDVPDPSMRRKYVRESEEPFPTIAGLDEYEKSDNSSSYHHGSMDSSSATRSRLGLASGLTAYDTPREPRIINKSAIREDGYNPRGMLHHGNSPAVLASSRPVMAQRSIPVSYPGVVRGIPATQTPPYLPGGPPTNRRISTSSGTSAVTHSVLQASQLGGVNPPVLRRPGVKTPAQAIAASRTGLGGRYVSASQQVQGDMVSSPLVAHATPRQSDPPPHRAMADQPPHRSNAPAADQPPHRVILQRQNYPATTDTTTPTTQTPMLVATRGTKPQPRGRGGSQGARLKQRPDDATGDELSPAPTAYINPLTGIRSISASSPRKQVHFSDTLAHQQSGSQQLIASQPSTSDTLIPAGGSPMRVAGVLNSPLHRTQSPPKMPMKTVHQPPHRIGLGLPGAGTPSAPPQTSTMQHHNIHIISSAPSSNVEPLPDNFIEQPSEHPPVPLSTTKQSPQRQQQKESVLPPEVAAVADSLISKYQPKHGDLRWGRPGEFAEEDKSARIAEITSELQSVEALSLAQKEAQHSAAARKRTDSQSSGRRKSDVGMMTPTNTSRGSMVGMPPSGSSSGENVHHPMPRGRGRPKGSTRVRSSGSQSSSTTGSGTVGAGSPSRSAAGPSPFTSPRPVGRPPNILKATLPGGVTDRRRSSMDSLNSSKSSIPNGLSRSEEEELAAISSDSDSDKSEEDWGDYTTRCICGFDHNDDNMIECETCKVWQHFKCMGITAGKASSTYYCELCQPRPLKLTREQARNCQMKRHKEEMKREAAKAKRKLEKKREKLAIIKKHSITATANRLGGKPQIHTPSHHQATKQQFVQKLIRPTTFKKFTEIESNEYSKRAKQLIALYDNTDGSSQILASLKGKARAKRMFVAPDQEGLVAVEPIEPGRDGIIMEYIGQVCLPDECTGRGMGQVIPFCTLYNGLAVELKDRKEENFICIDSRKTGNDSRYVRKSCRANCTLRHVISNGNIYFVVVASEKIELGAEITLPFDCDFGQTRVPIECSCASTDPAEPCLMNLVNEHILYADMGLGQKDEPRAGSSRNGEPARNLITNGNGAASSSAMAVPTTPIGRSAGTRPSILSSARAGAAKVAAILVQPEFTPERKSISEQETLKSTTPVTEGYKKEDSVPADPTPQKKSPSPKKEPSPQKTRSPSPVRKGRTPSTNKSAAKKTATNKKEAKKEVIKDEEDVKDVKEPNKRKSEAATPSTSKTSTRTASAKKEVKEVPKEMEYTLPMDRNKPSREERKIQMALAAFEKQQKSSEKSTKRASTSNTTPKATTANKKTGRKTMEPEQSSSKKDNKKEEETKSATAETPRGRTLDKKSDSRKKPAEKDSLKDVKEASRVESRESPRNKKKRESESVAEPEPAMSPAASTSSTPAQPPRKRWAQEAKEQAEANTQAASTPVVAASTSTSSPPASGKKLWLRRHALQSSEDSKMASGTSSQSVEEPKTETPKAEIIPPLKKRRHVVSTSSETSVSEEQKRREAASALSQLRSYGDSRPANGESNRGYHPIKDRNTVTPELLEKMRRAAKSVGAAMHEFEEFKLPWDVPPPAPPPVIKASSSKQQTPHAAVQLEKKEVPIALPQQPPPPSHEPEQEVPAKKQKRTLSVEDYRKRAKKDGGSTSAVQSEESVVGVGSRREGFFPSMQNAAMVETVHHIPADIADPKANVLASPPPTASLDDLKKDILGDDVVLPPPPQPGTSQTPSTSSTTPARAEAAGPRVSIADRLKLEFADQFGMALPNGSPSSSSQTQSRPTNARTPPMPPLPRVDSAGSGSRRDSSSINRRRY